MKPEFPGTLTLHSWFEQQVAQTPDAVALTFQGVHLTYRELNRRANQVAHRLRQCGVGRDTLVGLFMDRSVELAVGLIGILKAGGAYLPLDPAYPRDRLAFMLEDAAAPVILTQASLAAALPTTTARILSLDADRASLENEPASNPPPVSGPDDLAYVIFTSGSTGKPKGALITHHNVVRLLHATADWFHFHDGDVWTFFHSHAFDFSVWELWGALLYGGRVVMVPYATSRAPEEFYRLLVQEHVTVLNQTPAAFKQLINAEERLGVSPDLALRYVIFGGEALEMRSLKPWFERHGDARPRLVNMYGITETTVHVTYRPLSAADLGAGSVIGVPIPDLQVHVLDADGHPVPQGGTGELFVGGAGVARGYLNRPELTREKFLPDPFSGQPGARLYRTGDLGRVLPDGGLEYLGRCDHQVKLRGFRIELGEIETLLCQHPGVRDCVVVVRAVGKEKCLVAYLLARNGVRHPRSELRGFLQPKLPDYMVPAHFVWLNELPLTPHGKTDRAALPEPDLRAEVEASPDFVAPKSELERTIAQVWQSVLGLPTVGTADNFFEIGGTSVLMVQAHQRLEDLLSLQLDIADLFQYVTIGALARHLSHSAGPEPVRSRAFQDQAALQRAALSRRRAALGTRLRPKQEPA